MNTLTPLQLAFETTCDDTSVALMQGCRVIAMDVYSQSAHSKYGGVVPELASRDHQRQIIRSLDSVLNQVKINLNAVDLFSVASGPGLLGSLLVGVSFVKSLSLALEKPLMEINHLQAHVLSPWIQDADLKLIPEFPYLCLLISGGNTQLIWVNSPIDFTIIGQTMDDALGEAFDKAAKVLGLPYPGGPQLDALAQLGNPNVYQFSKVRVAPFQFSYSGVKTNFLNFILKHSQNQPDFIKHHLSDICASYQNHLIQITLDPLHQALKQFKPKTLVIAGGVSANSGFRKAAKELELEYNIPVIVPPLKYCTDNAAMIGAAAALQLPFRNQFPLNFTAKPRYPISENLYENNSSH